MEVNSMNNVNTTPVQTNAVSSTPQVKVQVAPTPQPQVQEIKIAPSEMGGDNVRSHVREMRNEDVEKQMRDLSVQINKRLTTNTEVNFSVHEGSKKLNVKIIDKESKKVLREWPTEKSLDMLAEMIDKEALVFDKKL